MKAIAIFFLNVFQNIIGITFGWLFSPRTKSKSYKSLSDIDKVKHLEKRRQNNGYKKKWLYYRCREEGLLDAYNKLFKSEISEESIGPKFSFGKYQGRFVEEVWKFDKNYIKWLSSQDWLDEYLDENDMIHELLHLEEENTH